MKREIKFRGKSIGSNKWLYGYLGEAKTKLLNSVYTNKVIFDNVFSFSTDNVGFVVKDLSVDENTIGQFTGLRDMNGKEVYEGDILKDKNGLIYKVEYQDCNAAFMIVCYNYNTTDCMGDFLIDKYYKVIGNIYDNPELLED